MLSSQVTFCRIRLNVGASCAESGAELTRHTHFIVSDDSHGCHEGPDFCEPQKAKSRNSVRLLVSNGGLQESDVKLEV
jgi:hypothetical protein